MILDATIIHATLCDSILPTGNSRRPLSRAAVVVSAACLLCFCCLAIVFSDGNTKLQRDFLTEVNAESTPSENPYCSVFSDSADCNQQAESDASKYWTSAEIREKLWSAMKALAEVIRPFLSIPTPPSRI